MKKLELKLKKDVLIVDVGKSFNHFKIYDDEIGFIFIENCIPRKELVKGSYKFLCKGSELTEEIASELVENYSDVSDLFISCLDDFINRIKIKGFYWLENPIEKLKHYDLWAKYGDFTQYGKTLTQECLKWKEAEEKTFRNPLIFVKK